MRFLKVIMMTILALQLATIAGAELSADQMAVKKYVKEKSMFTGTLDIFDKEIKKVRNFKLLKFIESQKEGVQTAKFRDNATGDILELHFMTEDGDYSVEIGKMLKKAKKKDDQDKKYTKKEVKDAIKNYIKQMTKFSDTYDLFDESKGEMRKLNFVDIDDELRQFGILYIMSVNFTEEGTGEKVKLDMTFENSGGRLMSKKVKFKK